MSSIQYRKYFADCLTEEVKKVYGDGSSYNEDVPQLDWNKDQKLLTAKTGQKIATDAVNNVSVCFEKVAKHNNNVHPVADELKRNMLSFIDAVPESSSHILAPPGVLEIMRKQKDEKQRHDRLKAFEAAEQKRLKKFEKTEADKKKADDKEMQELLQKCEKYEEGAKSIDKFYNNVVEVFVRQAVQLAQHPDAQRKVELTYRMPGTNEVLIETPIRYAGFPYLINFFPFGGYVVASFYVNCNDCLYYKQEEEKELWHPKSGQCWKDARYIWAALLPRFLAALHAAGYKAFNEEDGRFTAEAPKGKITIVL